MHAKDTWAFVGCHCPSFFEGAAGFDMGNDAVDHPQKTSNKASNMP
jgi:hypothetical protein